MEAKILFDQLNSACEDYGIPEGNGFTLQDDLHQGNSVEPEFRGIITEEGSHYSLKASWTGNELHNIPGRMKYISEKIKQVIAKPGLGVFPSTLKKKKKQFFVLNIR
eukprot:GHVP01025173.1.p1 GENE.GHVP01025173.1~~GHVP01025173.1.p1  ORF type:complete len:107 (+),score=18.84 GHVP01025173.1:47-367(+)